MEQIAIPLIFIITVAIAIPVGRYIAKVYAGEKTFSDQIVNPIDNFIYRFIGILPGIGAWAFRRVFFNTII